MIDKLKLLWLVKRLKNCRVVNKSNAQLRQQELSVDGKRMRPLDYITYVASRLPRVDVNGKQIDFVRRMREIYYKHGLKGLNLYVSYIRLRTQIELKKQKKKPFKMATT